MNASMTPVRAVRRMVAAVGGAFLVTLVGFWPLATEADDTTAAMAEGLDLPSDQTRVGSIEATSQVVSDGQDRNRWFLQVRFVNRDPEQGAVAQFTEQIERSSAREEMSRVMSGPRPLWTNQDRIALGPGQSTTVRHELPSKLGTQLAAYFQAQARAQAAAQAHAKTKAGAQGVALAANFFRTTVYGALQRQPEPRPAVQQAVQVQRQPEPRFPAQQAVQQVKSQQPRRQAQRAALNRL
jgi:hypothetical protein